MNPMIGKELRQRMREKKAWILPSLYLLTLGAVVIITYFFSTWDIMETGADTQGAEVGVAIFIAVALTQLSLLLLLSPVFSAGSITIEKEQRTLGSLLTSLLTAGQIWWGKFVAALLFLALLLMTGLPVLSLSFALGGVGPREVGMVALSTLIVVGAMTSIGLYCSAYFRRSVHATAISYGVVIALCVVTWIVFLIIVAALGKDNSAAVANPFRDWTVIPLYFNPYYLIVMALAPVKQLWPGWVLSTACFLMLGGGAFVLAARQIRKGGEQL